MTTALTGCTSYSSGSPPCFLSWGWCQYGHCSLAQRQARLYLRRWDIASNISYKNKWWYVLSKIRPLRDGLLWRLWILTLMYLTIYECDAPGLFPWHIPRGYVEWCLWSANIHLGQARSLLGLSSDPDLLQLRGVVGQWACSQTF